MKIQLLNVIDSIEFYLAQPDRSFLLNATIQRHASKCEKVDAEFARKLRNYFYADDLNSGAYNVENGFGFIQEG